MDQGLIISEASDGRLIRLEDGCRAIAEAKGLPEVKDIRDAAQLMMHYVRERDLGEQAAGDAAEIKVRAERRMGELLPTIIHHGGDRRSESSSGHLTLKNPQVPASPHGA